MKKYILILILLFILCLVGMVLASTTTFVKKGNSYYGKEAVMNKLTVTITPEVNDVNSTTSTAISADPIFGKLCRITLASTGTDTEFTVTVKDEDLITVFTKTDCNSALLPLTYNLSLLNFPVTSRSPDIPVAGPLTFETSGVDPNNLTSIIIMIYYQDFRYAGN